MSSRVTFLFLIVAAVVLLPSTNASGVNVDGTINNGVFSAPVPACGGPAQCTVNGNTVSWGTPIGAASSSLQETGVTFKNLTVGSQFEIGRLVFTNAETVLGTEITSVQLQVSIGDVFCTVPGDPYCTGLNNRDLIHSQQSFPIFTLGIVTTPNTSDPEASADIIRILSGQQCTPPCTDRDQNGNPILDEFHVFEGESASVGLLGFLGSQGLIGFAPGSVQGGGFLTASGVPEPSSLALVCGGLIYLALARRRKSSRQHRHR